MGDESQTFTSWQNMYEEEVSKRLLLEATLAEKEKSLERALHKLKVEEQRYALAFQGSQDGLWDWDLKSGSLFLSQRWLAMLGFEPGELPASLEGWIDRVYERDRRDLEAAIEAHFKEPNSTFSHEYRLRHKEGHSVWVLTRGVCLRDDTGEPLRFAGTQTDLTQQKTVQQQALYETLHDPLTGLANRTLLLERVGQALLRHQRDSKNSFALLFVGLELFKSAVDTSYVDQTDWILQEAGKRLLEICRHEDTVARWGGDHFVIFLDGYQDEEGLKVLADRLLEKLSNPFVVPSQEVVIPAFIGIALSARAYENADDAVWDAESAYFYAEKNTSPAPVFFEDHMRKKAKSFFQLHANLRQAIDQEEIFLVLQPILDLQDGRMMGIETLARWHHPRFGIVLPDTFFQLAEDESLKLSLENLILHKACYAYQSWPQETKPPFFSINLSYKTLEDNDFANNIFEALKEHNLAPEQLKIELTEKSLDAAGDSIHWVLKRLMKKGLGFMIDDFGQAGTSLSLLHSGLFEYVKLTRSLSAPTQTKDLIMAKSVMTLCQSLSLGLIAKGIETTAEQELFQKNGGRFAQGYHFSHPLTLDEARELPNAPTPSS